MARTSFSSATVTPDTIVERLVGFTVTATEPGFAQYDCDTYSQAQSLVRRLTNINGATYRIERYELTWTAAEVAERDYCAQHDC